MADIYLMEDYMLDIKRSYSLTTDRHGDTSMATESMSIATMLGKQLLLQDENDFHSQHLTMLPW